jgi:alpha-galactosidase
MIGTGPLFATIRRFQTANMNPANLTALLRLCAMAIAIALPLAGFDIARAADPAYWEWAQTPPMGWNSWDGFATTITEAQTRAQAEFMARNLRRHGWKYIVVDIQWYEPNANGFDYRKDAKLKMDEWSRLMPATNKFPSAMDGNGFKALADYVHGLGLKFGIHMLRGIPRQAVFAKTSIKGTSYTAADVADTNSTCRWNGDMFGVDMSKPGAQAYYDSLYNAFASWGIDYVKVDDLSAPYHRDEIEAIRKAIDRTGRQIVFSTSPGATPVDQGAHISTNANLWRISGDFWDNWPQLLAQFERLHDWTPFRAPGHFPDADMLPVGVLQMGKSRTHFSPDEQFTLLSLWSIARSPLMIGADLTKLDGFTLALLTNDEVIAVNQNSANNRELFHRDGFYGWMADVPGSPDKYVGLFNTRALPGELSADRAIFQSPPISRRTEGQGVKIDVDISGAAKLFLVVEEGHEDVVWSAPSIVTTNGPVKLTDLKWASATCGHGQVATEKSASGKDLLLAGKPVPNGIGTHATSVIEYDLPAGAMRFQSFAGLDGSGSNPQHWPGGDARFLVFTQSPFASEAASAVPVKFSELGFNGDCSVRDLWQQQDLGSFKTEFVPTINAHGGRLYRISPAK